MVEVLELTLKLTADQIAERFIEAFDTLRDLPPVVRKQKSTNWPPILQRAADIFGHGSMYQHSTELPESRDPPTAKAISDMDEVIESWWRWIPIRDRKPILWWWGGMSDRRIAKKIRVSHTTVKRRRRNTFRRVQRIQNRKG